MIRRDQGGSADGPTSGTIREPHRVVLDMKTIRGWELGTDAELVGCWHTHPRGDTESPPRGTPAAGREPGGPCASTGRGTSPTPR